MQIITELSVTGGIDRAKSACGRYEWFSGSPGYLRDTKAGRSIYQMAYLKLEGFGSDPLPADVKRDTLAFWAALHDIKAGIEAKRDQRRMALGATSPAASTHDGQATARQIAFLRRAGHDVPEGATKMWASSIISDIMGA